MSRSSPAAAARARRRIVCILPPSDRAETTLLPYYYPPRPEAPSIRAPPVDPRKSRRYCTDFGLGRALPPPPPLMYTHDSLSSAASTPQATYAETDSDVSSFYHDIDLDFPQPPASPALRRMQSSPLFTPEETNAVREFLRKRWGTHLKARQPEQDLADFSWDAESPTVEAGPDAFALELQGEVLIQAGAGRRQSWLHLDESVAPRVPPVRALRRAASMASSLTPHPEDAPPPLPRRAALRFQDPATPPSLASAGRQKPRHRPNLSVPLMGLAPPLDAPFTHRPALSQPTNFPRARAANPKSFIDLTPEKHVHRDSTARVHRDRVKKLLSRASSGIIGWGKGLAKKGHA
ncbi:hypothetical protein DFH09DRAFT_1359334 [Mycena vulgaris]|nr:hypothetical protein DFH09DRAFT_1359334 [Mycena vulgaris]